jgi:tyrosine-protein phosphatase YwqE
MLTYKILLEKFNGKYSDLYESQKEVLKEFITSVDSTPKLRTFYNNRIQQLKEELATISNTIADKAVQIKLNEVLPLIVEIEKNQPIRNENIVDLLQYCELVEELKAAHGSSIQ